MTLPAGTRLGPYEILSPLGAGGMGEVYRAKDTRLGREVVIKTLPSEFAADVDRVHRFEQEALSASGLNHPNIITVYDIGRQDGALYIAMELVDGSTLREILASGEPISPRKTLDLAVQIAEGLARAHAAGIVHRDLKPENVMVSKDGFVKILDFGLAKLAAPAGEQGSRLPTQVHAETHPGTVLGTIGYMSPEQASGRPLDFRSDQFSFGSVVYEMTTGQRAFQCTTGAETLTAIIREEPPPVAQVNPKAPPPLRWIVERCLAKDPEERYASTRDLARDLRSVRDHLSEASLSDEAVAAPVSRGRRRSLLAAMAAVVALGVGLFWGSRTRQAESVSGPVRSTLLLPQKVSFGCAAVSPDGSRIVFSGTDSSGRKTLWIRPLDSFAARPLSGTEGGTLPFWSPDGRSIGFFAGGKLKRIEAAGGSAVALCDSGGVGGTWNQNGDVLASEATGPILRIPASGGKASAVTKLNEARHELSHRFPQFLPDGRHFLYFAVNLAGNPEDDANQIHVASLDSGEDRVVMRGYSRTVYSQGYLLFSRGGSVIATLMAQAFDPSKLRTLGEPVALADQVATYQDYYLFGNFSTSESGTLLYDGQLVNSRLVWIDRTGRQVGVFGDLAPQWRPRISPDGTRVAFTAFEPSVGKGQIWVGDLARGVRSRLTNDPSDNDQPVWSPDGARIAFTSDRKHQGDIYQKPAGSGPEVAVSEGEGQRYPEDWSPDGRYIVGYLATARGTRIPSLVALPLLGDSQPLTVVTSESTSWSIFGNCRFSPDGRWVAYENDVSGRAEVYVTSFPNRDVTLQVSTTGGGLPTWKRDGRELFYVSVERKMMSVEVEPGPKLKAGIPRPLFDMPISTDFGGYDVTADGQRFLVSVPVVEGNSYPLSLVVNWTAGLKK